MQTINDWEEIPGIDKVIEHAKRHSVAAFSPSRLLWSRNQDRLIEVYSNHAMQALDQESTLRQVPLGIAGPSRYISSFRWLITPLKAGWDLVQLYLPPVAH